MTNEQAVIDAEKEIGILKDNYISFLTPVALKNQEKEEPTLQELLKCQQLGVKYFNFIENFVGNSGLLGAHANGKWVKGFAESCHSVLNRYVEHINFLKSHSSKNGAGFSPPDLNSYANMQRMVKEYLPKDQWKELEKKYTENSLPISGFQFKGANDLNKTPKWQLITILIVGLLFSMIILALAVFIPNPTNTQFFIFRGIFSVSLAAIAAVIPGLLNVESRFQSFSIKATGAIAVFIIVWLLNPPAIINS